MPRTTPGPPWSQCRSSRELDPGVKRNNAGYYNDRYTQLVNTIATKPDAAKRKALYPALNDFLLDESFYMAITGNPGKVLASARLKGLSYRPNDLFMCTEAWLRDG